MDFVSHISTIYFYLNISACPSFSHDTSKLSIALANFPLSKIMHDNDPLPGLSAKPTVITEGKDDFEEKKKSSQ